MNEDIEHVNFQFLHRIPRGYLLTNAHVAPYELSIPSPDSTKRPAGISAKSDDKLSIPSPDSTKQNKLLCLLVMNVSFNSFTGFHRRYYRPNIPKPIETFNSFTGFHARMTTQWVLIDEVRFQFLHRIPLMIIGRYATGPPGLFQFLHRIPPSYSS
mgnify:CR=1 FL=1